MAKQVPKKKGANGYKLPDPIPKGEILVDIAKKKWKIGASIGQGGFGEIYSAQEADSKSASFPFVVKIEPHENGPLFVEINFYIRNAKPQEVEEFKNKKKLKILGMPTYLGSGSHEHNNQKYRFLVMHKFGEDIWKLFLKNKRTFPNTTVFKIAVQILDVLEYIHEHGYIHGDIKGANILLGLSKDSQNQIYLVDFGLATKYQTGVEFKPNPKKAHDGTIEYLSRDAHQGVPTRRGDFEILAYNLIQWLGCTLPWERDLSNPVKVQEKKEEYMGDVEKLLKSCFGPRNVPTCLAEFLKYINNLSFDQKPDYEKIRKLFIKEIEKNGDKLGTPLVFSIRQTSPKRKSDHSENIKRKYKKAKEDDEKSDNEDDDGKIEKKKVAAVTSKVRKAKPKKTEETVAGDDFDGYTPEMRAIAMKKLENGVKTVSTRKKVTKENSDNKTSPRKNTPVDVQNGVTGRSRRNLKVINYNEAALSPK
ncbi:serine/threonine-protein kinase VRK1 [Coccinella septempunctata]|uniref:serine/threonine-protein kinase VRK1 n=1 Tax=Coccinella septempunctata TaxID=41139 RepID=UPI001D0621BA|nr:serine/threonine-protein kinase VRK1 [Coccinella septempunctata]